MENISKKHLKEFRKIKEEMMTALSDAELLMYSTLNTDSIVDNIAVIRVQISLLKEFEERMVNFLGEALCQSKQQA